MPPLLVNDGGLVAHSLVNVDSSLIMILFITSILDFRKTGKYREGELRKKAPSISPFFQLHQLWLWQLDFLLRWFHSFLALGPES